MDFLLDDRSLQRESENRKRRRMIGKEISWYTKYIDYRLAHTGDYFYLLNDLKMLSECDIVLRYWQR